MRVALIISGYLRSFKVNLPLIKQKIIDKYDVVDVYIHITKNELKDDKYFNPAHEEEDIKLIKEILKPIAILEEDNLDLHEDKKLNNLYNLWLKYYKLNQIKLCNETHKGVYDLVIKYRPDLNIIEENVFSEIEKGQIYIPEESVVDRSKLKNQTDPHICDIFAYGSSHSMDLYFEIYKHLNRLVTKYNTPISETLLYYYLNDYKISYKLIKLDYNVILSTCNIFAICGDSGSGKTTLSESLKKYFSDSFTLECDRYHKWERHDDNWKNYTHLNPEANYISKMNKDIFDLKIGKNVYHVNYDHNNGKFTSPEEINKSDNVIVCGLHSFYNKHEGVYNLKIFLDTDIKLKTRWKILRDSTNRGYSVEEVKNQIDKRSKDYLEYIYPQRKESDIIVNFYTNDESFLEENEPNVHLNLLINKKYSLTEVLAKLTSYNIPYTVTYSQEENFNCVNFLKFQSSNLLGENKFKQDNFYDYIIFFILSLS
jgi:uridine kinase